MPSRRDLANAIRALALDAVAQANSGHTGMPLGMADIAEVLWNDFLEHNPTNPQWFNRDRFVISNGHGSMLLYSLLHLTGYDLPIEEIKNFRQLHSKTAGHPELGLTPGVETTTGPLGQGLANAVGMAIAERQLAAQYNQPEHSIIDHYTYAFCGDGCLMEGVSHEVCSLAGTLGLGKLIVFYDDNGISIDGHVHGWFRDDAAMRFRAYGWHVIEKVDGHDAEQVRQAIIAAREETDKPTMICCQTTIGFGAPTLANTNTAHGAITDADEIAGTKKNIGWESTTAFEIPQDIYSGWDARTKGNDAEQTWQQRWQTYATAHPDLAESLERRRKGDLPQSWQKVTGDFIKEQQSKAATVATRKASQQWLTELAPHMPELLGGSADLTGSNGTRWNDAVTLDDDVPEGNYLYYGVREFGMSAIMNGLALHGGFIPFGGTFLVFLDYARNAIRMAALMQQRVVFVYSHDSIGVGEDGPTHQPIEHLSMLRATPNLDVWRPADATETAVAWQQSLERHDGPAAMILTRQNVPGLTRATEQVETVKRGGYILFDSKTTPDCILIASGSEVSLAMDAAIQLQQQGVAVRVVSMPCIEAFLRQDESYQQDVLPNTVTKRIAIEAGATQPWYRFVGLQGKVIGIDRFGESAPCKEVYEYLGVTTAKVVSTANDLV